MLWIVSNRYQRRGLSRNFLRVVISTNFLFADICVRFGFHRSECFEGTNESGAADTLKHHWSHIFRQLCAHLHSSFQNLDENQDNAGEMVAIGIDFIAR